MSDIRAFIAIELPSPVKRGLAQMQTLLGRERLPFVRWVDPAGIHLTLKFLGNVPEAKASVLEGALRPVAQGCRPLALELARAGGFPSVRSPRVVWVGLAGDLEGLVELQANVEGAAQWLSFPREEHPFSPHLTLGRLRREATAEERRRLGESIASAPEVGSASFVADSICLMQSLLGPGGARYRCLVRLTFGTGLPRGEA